MRRLRASDGTTPHRRAAQFHLSKCQMGKAPIHAVLYTEMKQKRDGLIVVSRKVEDAEDVYVGAVAESEAAEEALEDIFRDIDGELARLDREDPSRNAQATVFPNGFGAVIEPDGDKQLEVLPAVKTKLKTLSSLPSVAAGLSQVEAAETILRAKFKAEEDAADVVEQLFTEENEARREIREQMESAYGRLRDFYKARPALTERFFQKEARGRRSAAKPPSGGAGPQGAGKTEPTP